MRGMAKSHAERPEPTGLLGARAIAIGDIDGGNLRWSCRYGPAVLVYIDVQGTIIECVGDGVRWVGDPVDVVTGALVESAAEFTIPGPIPIVWQRYYDSRCTDTDGPLGRGHTHGLVTTLRAGVDGWVVSLPDHDALLFPYDDPAASQHGWRLAQVAGQHHLRSPDGIVSIFPAPIGDAEARIVRLTNGLGVLDLAYDAAGRLVEISDLERDRVVALQYVAGRIAALVLTAHPTREPGQPLVMMRYEYDAQGRLIGVTDRHRHRRTYTHDAAHRLIARTDRGGYRFEYEYDAEGRCVASRGHDGTQAIRLRYMPEAQATVVRNGDGGEWLHRYDASLAITEIIDPYGGSRRFEYDADGRLIAETDPGGNRRVAVHDDADEVAGWINAAGVERPADDPTGPRAHRVPTTAAALEFGDLAVELLVDAPVASPGIEPLLLGGGASNAALFEPRDPRVEHACRRDEQGILGAEEHPAAPPRRWAYNPNGWPRIYIDHDGSRYEFEYASWDHRVAARDPLGRTLRYEYTWDERVAAVIDPAGNRHEYHHDRRGDLVEVHHSGALVETYQHDRAGNWTGKRDARGELLFAMAYGEDNLLARRTLASGEEHVHAHTPDGRLARIAYGEHTLEFAHTAEGRRRRDVRDGRGVEHVFVDERLIETRVLDRFVTRYRRLDDKTLELTDPLGNRHAVVLEREGVVVRRMACGAREVAQYDSLGRCLGKHLFAAETGEPVWRRRFERSAEGDLVRVDDSESGPTEYRHDSAHQLAAVLAPGAAAETYRYDLAGNLIAAPHLSDVVIAPGNRLVEASGGTLTYDLRNNVATWRRHGRVLRFHRDELDHVRRIDGLERPWSAEYDPLGRRTRKTHGAETTEYFWDTDRLAAELRADGRLQVYVYLDDFAPIPWLAIEYDSLDADPTSGRLHYLLTDQRGAPIAALDAAGRRVWTAALDPYGNAKITRAAGSTFELPHRLAGQHHDPETGLCYHRFRYYAPELGRYLEEDPAGTGGGVNLYAYTYNPLTHFDLRGLACPVEEEHKKQLEAYRKKYQDRLDNEPSRTTRQQAHDKGRITEVIGELGASNYMSKHYPDHEMVRGFAAGKGVDQIWVKKDANGKVTEIIVVEAKGPGAKLGDTKTMGPQMSNKWMDKTAKNMAKKGDPSLKNALKKGDPKVKGVVVTADKNGNGATESFPTGKNYPTGGVYN